MSLFLFNVVLENLGNDSIAVSTYQTDALE